MRRLAFAFGSFPGVGDNPSRFAAAAAAADTEILPVSYAAVDARIAALGDEALAVLAFGVAARSDAPRIELFARNRDGSAVPDVDGLRRDGVIDADAPELLPGVGTRELLAALSDFGAEASRDAGDYLCNHLYWRLLRRPATRACFIHIPPRRDPAWYAALGRRAAAAFPG